MVVTYICSLDIKRTTAVQKINESCLLSGANDTGWSGSSTHAIDAQSYENNIVTGKICGKGGYCGKGDSICC